MLKHEFGQSNLAASKDFEKMIPERDPKAAEILSRYGEAFRPLPPFRNVQEARQHAPSIQTGVLRPKDYLVKIPFLERRPKRCNVARARVGRSGHVRTLQKYRDT